MSSEYDRIKREVMARRERSSDLRGLVADTEHHHLLDRLKAQEMSLNKQSMSIRSMLVRMADEHEPEQEGIQAMAYSTSRVTSSTTTSPTRHKSNQTALDSIRRMERNRLGPTNRVDLDLLSATTTAAAHVQFASTAYNVPNVAKPAPALQLHHLTTFPTTMEENVDDPVYQAQHELQRLRQHREQTLQQRIQQQSEAVQAMERMREEAIARARRERTFQRADQHFRTLHQTHALQVFRHVVKVHKRFRKVQRRQELQQLQASFQQLSVQLQQQRRIRMKGFFYEIQCSFHRIITALRCNVHVQQDRLKAELVADRWYYGNLVRSALQTWQWTKRRQAKGIRRAKKYHGYRLLRQAMSMLYKRYRRVTKVIAAAEHHTEVFLQQKLMDTFASVWQCLQWNIVEQQAMSAAVMYHQEAFSVRAWRLFAYRTAVLGTQRVHLHHCAHYATMTLKRRYFARLFTKSTRHYPSHATANSAAFDAPRLPRSKHAAQGFSATQQHVSHLRALHKDAQSVLLAYFRRFLRVTQRQQAHRRVVGKQFERQFARAHTPLYVLAKTTTTTAQLVHRGTSLLQWAALWRQWRTASSQLHGNIQLYRQHRTAAQRHMLQRGLHRLQLHTTQWRRHKAGINDKCRLRRLHHLSDILSNVFTHLRRGVRQARLLRITAVSHHAAWHQRRFLHYLLYRLQRKHTVKARREAAAYWTRIRRGCLIKWRLSVMLAKQKQQTSLALTSSVSTRKSQRCLAGWHRLAADHSVEARRYDEGKAHWRKRLIKRAWTQVFKATFSYNNAPHATHRPTNNNVILVLPSTAQQRIKEQRIVVQKKLPVVLLKRCFQSFRKYHNDIVVLPQRRYSVGKQHHGTSLLRCGFAAWTQRYHNTVEQHSAIRDYRIYVQTPLLQRRLFRCLQARQVQLAYSNELLQLASEQYVRSCAKQLLREWKQRVVHRIATVHPAYSEGKRQHRRQLLRTGLTQFLYFANNSHAASRRLKSAAKYHTNVRSLGPGLQQWHAFSQQLQHVKYCIKRAAQQHTKRLLKTHFIVLTQRSNVLSKYRMKAKNAKTYLLTRLLKTSLQRWRGAARSRTQHRSLKQRARSHRNTYIKRIIFQKGFLAPYRVHLIETAQVMTRCDAQCTRALHKRYLAAWRKRVFQLQGDKHRVNTVAVRKVLKAAFRQQWYVQYHSVVRRQQHCMSKVKKAYSRRQFRRYVHYWRCYVERRKANVRHVANHEAFLAGCDKEDNNTVVSMTAKGLALQQARRKQALLVQKEAEKLAARTRSNSVDKTEIDGSNTGFLSLSSYNLHSASSGFTSAPLTPWGKLANAAGVQQWKGSLSAEEVRQRRAGLQRYLKRVLYLAQTKSYHSNGVVSASKVQFKGEEPLLSLDMASITSPNGTTSTNSAASMHHHTRSTVTCSEALLLLSSRVLIGRHLKHWMARREAIVQGGTRRFQHAIKHHNAHLQSTYLQQWHQHLVHHEQVVLFHLKRADNHHTTFQRSVALFALKQYTAHRQQVHIKEKAFLQQLAHVYLWRWKSRTRSNVSMPKMVVGSVQLALTRARSNTSGFPASNTGTPGSPARKGRKQSQHASPHRKRASQQQAVEELSSLPTFDCVVPMWKTILFLQLRSNNSNANTTSTVDEDDDKASAPVPQRRLHFSRESQAYHLEHMAAPHHSHRLLHTGFARLLQLTRAHHTLQRTATRFHHRYTLQHAWTWFRSTCQQWKRVNATLPDQAEQHELSRMRRKALQALLIHRGAVQTQRRRQQRILSKLWHAWYVASRKQLKLRRSMNFLVNHQHLRTLKQAWNSWHADTLTERSIELHVKRRMQHAMHHSIFVLRSIVRGQYKQRMKILHAVLQRRRPQLAAATGTQQQHHPPNALQIVRQFRGTALWKYCQQAAFHTQQRTFKQLLKHLARKYQHNELLRKSTIHHLHSTQRNVIKHLYYLRRNRIAQQFHAKMTLRRLRTQTQQCKLRQRHNAASLQRSRRAFQRHCVRQWHTFLVQQQQHRNLMSSKLKTQQWTRLDLHNNNYYHNQRMKFALYKLAHLFTVRVRREKKATQIDSYYISALKRRGLRTFLHHLKHDIRVKRNQRVLSLWEQRLHCKRALRVWQWKVQERFLKSQLHRLHDPHCNPNARYNNKLKQAFQHIRSIVQRRKQIRVVQQQQAALLLRRSLVESIDEDDDPVVVPAAAAMPRPASNSRDNGGCGVRGEVGEEEEDNVDMSRERRSRSRDRKLDREQRRMQLFSLQ